MVTCDKCVKQAYKSCQKVRLSSRIFRFAGSYAAIMNIYKDCIV